MHSSGLRMRRTIDDMLDLARGRLAGGIPITREPIDIGTLVDRVVVDARPRAAGADRRRTDGAAACDGGPDRLAEVLSNLIGNALQHGVAGEPVAMRLDGTAPTLVVIEVENAGEIAPEALPRLFEAFARGPGRSREDGLGLGLYITQQIAQAHGGAVTARSEGGATAIRVTLPRSVVATRQPEGARS